MNFLILGELFKRMSEGGPVFMYPILFLLMLCIGIGIVAYLKGDENGRKKNLISHVSLFTLVWGFLGMMIGLIEAFDAISMPNNDVAMSILAGGLKIGLLCPTFGLFAFLIGRLLIIGLFLKEKPINE